MAKLYKDDIRFFSAKFQNDSTLKEAANDSGYDEIVY